MTIEDLRQMNEEGKFPQKFSEEELQKILEVEKFVNDMVHENIIVSTEVMPIDKAKEM